MDKPKWFVYVLKNFLGVVSVWQLDHAFSKYVWEADVTIEIARIFTLPLIMRETDFWVLCFFTLILALFLPEIYEIIKYVKLKINKLEK